jgi:hypothetical protein
MHIQRVGMTLKCNGVRDLFDSLNNPGKGMQLTDAHTAAFDAIEIDWTLGNDEKTRSFDERMQNIENTCERTVTST